MSRQPGRGRGGHSGHGRPVGSGGRVALVAIFAVNGAVIATWATRIPAIKQSAGLSTGQLGVLLLAPAAGALAAFEPAGRAVARFGNSRATAVGAVAFALSLPLVGLARSAPVGLFAALVWLGVTNGALDVAMNTAGVAVEGGYGRPVMSGLHAAFSAGGLAGAAAGGVAAAAGLGVGTHFALTAAVATAVVLAALPSLRHAPASPGTRRASPARPAAAVARGSGPARAAPWRRALPLPVVLLGAVGFACLLGEGAAGDWSATYLREGTAAGPGLAAAGYGGFSAAMLIGRLSGDSLRARVAPAVLLPACVTLAAAGLAAGLAAGGSVAGIVGFTLFGAGLAVVVPVVFVAAGTLSTARTGLAPGTALARVNTLGYLGFLAGPPLVGAVASLIGLRLALLGPALLAAAVVPLSRAALRSPPTR